MIINHIKMNASHENLPIVEPSEPIKTPRSLEERDLKIIIERAISANGFSPLDFKNCNKSDLAALSSLISEEIDDAMSEDEIVFIGDKDKRNILMGLQVSIQGEQLKHMKPMLANLSSGFAEVQKVWGGVEDRLHKVGGDAADMLTELEGMQTELTGMLEASKVEADKLGESIVEGEAARTRIAVLQAEQRPTQGEES